MHLYGLQLIPELLKTYKHNIAKACYSITPGINWRLPLTTSALALFIYARGPPWIGRINYKDLCKELCTYGSQCSIIRVRSEIRRGTLMAKLRSAVKRRNSRLDSIMGKISQTRKPTKKKVVKKK